ESEDPKAVKTRFAFRPAASSRVEYSLVAIGLRRENSLHKDPYIGGYAYLIPSLTEKTTGYLGFDAGVFVPLAGDDLQLQLRGFARSFTNDEWMLSSIENSFISTMTGDDYLDYWERQGGEIGLRYRATDWLTLDGRVSFQRDLSLDARRVSSILDPVRKYRENPPVDEGERLAVSGSIRLDNRGEEQWRDDAWLVDLWIEKGIADGPGDFSYTAFDIDVRRYTYLPWTMRFDLRAKIFSSFTSIPAQLSRTLNGYGGIRGLTDLPFGPSRGDRMALFSAEFRRRLPEVPVFRWIFSRWDLLLFADLGIVAKAENVEAPFRFLDLPSDRWRKSAGLGFAGESILPYLGFYIAQDLDADSFEPRFIIRAERSF
ncbi:MAG TPA: BamA/TamA family outer membrane protein, partial [Candidatus Krumholzibacterium sp.]|nr:BamA/TamA family outer membrane protein [Candidatus Krumholzibacterium sp.]